MPDSRPEVQELAARSWVIHYADDSGNPAQGLNAIVSGPRVLPADPVVEVVPLSVAEKLAVALAEVKRVAAIEAPPVSDEVPAKVWKLAYDALAEYQGQP